MYFFFFFFFFSSRRRHTRFDCDWSSDVCSSDLFSRFMRETVSTSVPNRRAMLYTVSPFSTLIVAHPRSEEHTSELQSQSNLVCRLLLEKKKKKKLKTIHNPTTIITTNYDHTHQL